MKLQAFDKFYSKYKVGMEKTIKENMEKIIEVIEENGNTIDVNKNEEKTVSNEQNDILSCNNKNDNKSIIYSIYYTVFLRG